MSSASRKKTAFSHVYLIINTFWEEGVVHRQLRTAVFAENLRSQISRSLICLDTLGTVLLKPATELG